MNYVIRNPQGNDVAAFVSYRDARKWADSQGAGYPIVVVDDE